VERQLGRGGMGAVYLVQHLHTDQRLALKLLHATVVKDEVALTRFRREARAPAKINSDHVVQVTDADVAPELDGVPFLVMEWLRGHDLEELVVERGRLSPQDVVLYLRHTARALDKAHALGVVHRDLKPENLFLTQREDGTPCLKILDFGIAKLTGADAEGRLKATGTGQIFGTPLYMSPEQMKGETDRISPATDVWALGIIAHRLLAGAEPWTATTLTALVAQIAYEPLPVPSERGLGLPRAFDGWFARCCAREPSARFASAGEAVAALARALGLPEEAGSLVPSSLPVAVIAPSRRDSDGTAFSATAPAPLSTSSPEVAATKVSPAAPPSQTRLILGAAAILVASAVGAWAVVSSRRPAAAQAAPPASATQVPADARSAPQVTVTPSSAAPVLVEPAPSASASAKPVDPGPRPVRPTVTVTVAKTAAPAAPPTAPTPPPVHPPPPPVDPLGTRN
jgi:serine/threonine-protein kinase